MFEKLAKYAARTLELDIDCDAYTGGFNLQIAWATAYAAGMAAGETEKE